LIRLSGNGKGVFGSFGGIVEKELLPGEEYIVDTGHVVAFDSTITYDVKAFGGIKSFFFGGEGLIVRMKGPGRIFYQTRNYPAFLQWIKTTSKATGGR
ncbi:MAG TPA: AIM24 family protein, partial [Thermotoga sp.]|nr:AIM24 family protein [Thermotoga sp.]